MTPTYTQNTEREIIMATTTATAGAKNNDSGRVLQGGNVQSGRFSNLALTDTVSNSQKNGAVAISATSGAVKSSAGRTFGKTQAGQYIILTYTKSLGGVADTTLSTAAQGRTPDFPKIEVAKTGFLKSLSWDAEDNDLPAYSLGKSAKTVSMGEDRSCQTTHRITYLQGASTPTTNTDRSYD